MCKSKQSKYRFVKLSATTAGIQDVKDIVKVAKNELNLSRRLTVLFVDEIHRFNKLQQVSMDSFFNVCLFSFNIFCSSRCILGCFSESLVLFA